MNNDRLIAIATIVVPLLLAAIIGAVHNAIKVAQLETQMKILIDWWKEHYRKEGGNK